MPSNISDMGVVLYGVHFDKTNNNMHRECKYDNYDPNYDTLLMNNRNIGL